VTFPKTIANHNVEQVFYYDDAFMQRRMDYSPDVTGRPPVAHYTHDHKTFDGFVFPTRRLVHLHDASGVANQRRLNTPQTGGFKMTTYLINHLRQPGVVNSEVLDYVDQVQATLDPFGGKFIVQGGEMEVLEGARAGSVILLSFPDMTQARTWYKSPAYQVILHLRTDHVVGDVILVDGVVPDHTPGKFAQQIRDMLAAGTIKS
jgi:uncharacterized protein (DUF1330 family)